MFFIFIDIISDSCAKDILNRDPDTDTNKHKFSDDELRYLVSKGPFQPHVDFLINERYQSQKQTYKFVPSWYEDFSYIEYSVVQNKIYCFICRLFGFGADCEQSELGWIKGTDKWNKMKNQGKKQPGKLVAHSKSKSHVAAFERYQNFMKKESHVDLMLDSCRQKLEQQRVAVFKYNRTVVSTLIDISHFLSRQSLAFRGSSGSEEEGIFQKK